MKRPRCPLARRAVVQKPLFLALAWLLAAPASADPPEPRYDNTFQKDFVMDAPWRVDDVHTAIPIVIVLKDCDTNDVRQLHWIRAWDVTAGETLLWDHSFGDERIGDDPYESNYWTYITTVTEGHPALPDGTPLSPSNLGHGPGDAVALRVSISYRDDLFNYTETRHLRVHVAHDDYPWPQGWYGGDTHYHTMYTNNTAEFGLPLPAVRLAGSALGLHWLTATDHSCDLDETGDGSYSYATTHWEYTIQDESGIHTVLRDNEAIGSTWDVLASEVALFDSPTFRVARGVELNVASVDGESYQKTLHSLVYAGPYIESPLSGALGERPVTPFLPDALSEITEPGFMFAAHPLSDMSAEWGGLDWGINGAPWGDEDIEAGLSSDAFRGLEAFNTRPTRSSTDVANPWPDFDAGVEPDNPYPEELLAGIAAWDLELCEHLEPLRKVFLSGGSDAHGDLNYSSYIALDNYATDNAIGKVQTVVFVPGPYGPGDLPPADLILSGLRAGRSVATDGPFVELGVDRNEDGDFTDVLDLMIGGDATVGSAETLPLTVRWRSTEDFGPVVSVQILSSSPSGTTTLLSTNPSGSGQGWSGEAVVELGAYGFEGPRSFRAECRTQSGDQSYRAYANPIWVMFDTTLVAEGTGDRRLDLALRTNPFAGAVELAITLPSAGGFSLEVFDLAGRRVSALSGATERGSARVLPWDAAREANLAAGVYFFRLAQDGDEVVRKGVLLR